MKKLWVTGLVLMLAVGGLVSSVTAAPYVSGNFGMVSLNDSTFSEPGFSAEVSTDPGFGFIAAVGNTFDGLRGEAEVAYRINDLDKISAGGISDSWNGEITSISVMGNLLVDIPLSESIRPFLGAGIGLAMIDADISGAGSEDDTVFAYQGIVGIGFPLTHVTTLDLQYRYLATNDPDFAGTKAEYQSNNFFAGLRFDF